MLKGAICLFLGMLFGIPLIFIIVCTLTYALFALALFKIFTFILGVGIATIEILFLLGMIKLLLDFFEGCV